MQKIPELLSLVHALIEKKQKRQFILTGSSARKLKRSDVDLWGRTAACRWTEYSMGSLSPAEQHYIEVRGDGKLHPVRSGVGADLDDCRRAGFDRDTVRGIVLPPERDITLDGSFYGEIIGGGRTLALMSGAVVNGITLIPEVTPKSVIFGSLGLVVAVASRRAMAARLQGARARKRW